jgi:2-deoxy-D-gluconate 3-dehydrogenase
VFLLSQLAGKVMLEQGSGRIINIASMTSYFGSKRIPAYTASKGGIMQLTKALSNEWCGRGVNVNAIAPGYMLSEFWLGKTDTEQGRANSARIPAGRWGLRTIWRERPFSSRPGRPIMSAERSSPWTAGIWVRKTSLE